MLNAYRLAFKGCVKMWDNYPQYSTAYPQYFGKGGDDMNSFSAVTVSGDINNPTNISSYEDWLGIMYVTNILDGKNTGYISVYGKVYPVVRGSRIYISTRDDELSVTSTHKDYVIESATYFYQDYNGKQNTYVFVGYNEDKTEVVECSFSPIQLRTLQEFIVTVLPDLVPIISTIAEEVNGNTESIADLSPKYTALQTMLSATQQQVNTMSEDLQDIQDHLNDVDKQNSQLRMDYTGLEQRINDLVSKNNLTE